MNRRQLLLAGLAASAVPLPAFAQAQKPLIEVYKSPSCGCCEAWAERAKQAGYGLFKRDVSQERLSDIRSRRNIAYELRGCHIAFVEGYVLEGHVPYEDIDRLLADRPDAIGLAVPGMPVGAPGMDYGSRSEAFETLLVLADGSTKVFQRHG